MTVRVQYKFICNQCKATKVSDCHKFWPTFQEIMKGMPQGWYHNRRRKKTLCPECATVDNMKRYFKLGL